MARIGVTDNGLLRFLERSGGIDVEQLRAAVAASLDRAHAAARSVSQSDYIIKADGLLYVVRGDAVTTVLEDRAINSAAHAMDPNRSGDHVG